MSKRSFLLAGLIGASSFENPLLAAAASSKIPKRTPASRISGSADDQVRGIVAGNPDFRFAADEVGPYRDALGTHPILGEAPWLALSTGGDSGAFGAGLLKGWSDAGSRPKFAVVTGVSTGALIAPFAFLGSEWDAQLREAYTTISAADVFEIGATPMSLLDDWPLARLISRHVTPDLLAAIAREHIAGRRLFVVTTNLDSGCPVAWNMGAIALRGDTGALRLFGDILLASGSIPGLFPPVFFDVEVENRSIREVHADGGVTLPFYLAPEILINDGGNLPAREIYVVINNRLDPEFLPVQARTLSVLGNALSTAVKSGTRAALKLHGLFAHHNGIMLRTAAIDSSFRTPSSAPFDTSAMQSLYAYARFQALQGTAFAAPAIGLFAAKS